MATKVINYRIYCNSESTWVSGWGTTAPTVCYNNNTHDVNLNSVQELDSVEETVVTVKEEKHGQTGGNFAVETVTVTVGANETKATDFSWPFGINVFALEFQTANNQSGDVFDIRANPETPIGSLTADISAGGTIIEVSSTVMLYAKIGFEITLDDGTNSDFMGRIIGVDQVNNRLTMETACSNTFLASTPTVVKLTVHMLRNYTFGPPGPVILGESKIGGSFMPANSIVQLTYQSNTAEAKTFYLTLEYLY